MGSLGLLLLGIFGLAAFTIGDGDDNDVPETDVGTDDPDDEELDPVSM
ncbi:MAG: hypothetical protein AAFP87_17225 [Pseudomonadota bacterium]